MAKWVTLGVVGVVIFGVIAVGLYALSVVNTEVGYATSVRARSTTNEAQLDKMWKTLQQKANITEKAAAEIKDMNKVYEELVQGREGGSLFKMVTENYPNLKQEEVAKLFQNLMADVGAERNEFLREQKAIVDVVREHDLLRERPISGLVLSLFGKNTKFYRKDQAPEGHPESYTYMFVTSGKTKIMAETGEENDIDLFSKDKE